MRDPNEVALHVIAQWLDLPSVYMGGPSGRSMRKAEDILDLLALNRLKVVEDGPG